MTTAATAPRWAPPPGASPVSGDTGGDCVEVAELTAAVAVRDSKVPDGPHLTVAPAAFTAFVRAAARSAAG